MFMLFFAALFFSLDITAQSVNYETFFAGQQITDQNTLAIFNREVIKNSKPVILKFYTKTCGPCVMTKRPYEALARTYTNKALFIELDAHKFGILSNQLQVSKVPLIICFSQGREQIRFMGAGGVDQLRSHLARIIPG